MLWRGQPVSFQNPAEAQAHGIAMVHQECLLAQHLSVAENIFLGRQPSHAVGTREPQTAWSSEAARLIEEHHFPLQADWIVQKLSPAQKQLVEICRAIQAGSGLLIFDEPTSSLSESETKEVFRIVRELRERGTGVIYITHRLDELRSVGDRVTILRDGEWVHTCPLAELDTAQLIKHMVGREVTSIYSRSRCPRAGTVACEGLSRKGVLHDISFTPASRRDCRSRRVWSARDEPSYAGRFSASTAIDAGRYSWRAKPSNLRNPGQAVRAGIALIPEDRGRDGLGAPASDRLQRNGRESGPICSSWGFCITTPRTR